jgi:ATP-dependent Clp protease adaptor protein ClpS
MPDYEYDQDEGVLTEREEKITEPPLYKVLLHNDDYTTMEFVIYVLETIFHKPYAEAERLMRQVHVQGIALAGIYPFEIAEVKVDKVIQLARDNEFPFLATMEKV